MRPGSLGLPGLIAGLLLLGCGPDLVLELRHPRSFDPSTLAGGLRVSLLTESGQTLAASSMAAGQLGSRQVLFPSVSLKAGQRYQVRVVSDPDPRCAGAAALGISPVFTYGEALGRLAIYLDCADTSSATGSTQDARALAAGAWLADPDPYGQAVIVGGTDIKQNDLVSLATSPPVASIEAYDPVTGTFRMLAPLSVARAAVQATAVGRDRVIVSGGLTRTGLTVAGSALVEQLKDGQVSPLPTMQTSRGLHRALLLGDLILLAGGLNHPLVDPLKAKESTTLELYNLAQPSQHRLLTLTAARIDPALAALDDKRAIVLGGAVAENRELRSDLFCHEGCSCGGDCLLEAAAFPAGPPRNGLAAVQVPCPGQRRGAVYVLGGLLTKSTTDYQPLDDIYCVSPEQPTAPMTTPVGRLLSARAFATASLVRGPAGQRIFVAGGLGKAGMLASGELIPVSCTCPAAPATLGKISEVKLTTARVRHVSVGLGDGTVLLVGGVGASRSAERFNPAF